PGLAQQVTAGTNIQAFVAAAGGGVRPAGPGDANAPQATGLPSQQNGNGTSGGESEDSDSDTKGAGASSNSTSSSGSTSASSSSLGQQVFGGGPILGVASSSKMKTVREFCNKSHYNDWPFVYDPTADRGGMLTTPTCPNQGQAGGFGQAIGTGPAGVQA